MAFSEKKFLELKAQTQAKKCADLLRDLIAMPGKEWKSKIHLYNSYVSWTKEPHRYIKKEELNYEAMLTHYKFWRTLSGLGFEAHVLSQLQHTDIPEATSPLIPWRVWMHNLRSAHNVGSIIRTADCFAWSGVIGSGYTAPKDHKGVSQAALGAQSWVNYEQFETQADALNSLQNITLVSLELTPEAVPIQEFIWPEQGVLILGNEEFGVNSELLSLSKSVVQIPQFGRKGSLNVANAFSIAAFSCHTQLSQKNNK
jgi:tRNA G18 (ribose-2'-O)-methylase SpoU